MSSWMMVNVKSESVKKCAFCRNWYDPTNSAIRLKSPAIRIWEFDLSVTKPCTTRPGDRKAFTAVQILFAKFESIPYNP